MKSSSTDLVKSVLDRITIPDVYVRIRALINDPNAHIDDYVDVVNTDPVMASRIIKIANSSFFGYSKVFDSVERAVSYIGVIQLQDVLLGTIAMRSFVAIPDNVVNLLDFWKTSVECGIVARILARRCDLLASERLFVSGLLHEIGHVVIYLKLPELAQQALFSAMDRSIPVYLAERELIGFDYAQVGSELMRLWHLPASYQETTAFHTEPAKATQYQAETAIVHLARHITFIDESDNEPSRFYEQIDPIVWTLTNLSEAVIGDVRQEARQHYSEVMRLLLPGPQLTAFETSELCL